MPNSAARVVVSIDMEYEFGPIGDNWTVAELRERAAKDARSVADRVCREAGKPTIRLSVRSVGVPGWIPLSCSRDEMIATPPRTQFVVNGYGVSSPVGELIDYAEIVRLSGCIADPNWTVTYSGINSGEPAGILRVKASIVPTAGMVFNVSRTGSA